MKTINVEKATRDAYGLALVELAEYNSDVVVFDSDLSKGTRTNWFQEKFPDKFFNLGIAEQNMVGIAAGISLRGFIPFVTTYAIFIGRAFDQIRQAISFSKSNVKIVATHSGLSAAFDGGSHQGLEDIAIMRVLPNMTILSPADFNEIRQAIFAAAAFVGPVYIRIGKFEQPVFTDEEKLFQIGKADILRVGSDLAIFATGVLVYEALKAADFLNSQGISVEVVNVSTIKPLDKATLVASATKCKYVITAEEHNKIGGLYSAVCELLSSCDSVKVGYVAMDDRYGETGDWNSLLAKYNLSSEGIIDEATKILKIKIKTNKDSFIS